MKELSGREDVSLRGNDVLKTFKVKRVQVAVSMPT